MAIRDNCPKCGSGWMQPVYVLTGNQLRFTCACGYSVTMPALDTKPKP